MRRSYLFLALLALAVALTSCDTPTSTQSPVIGSGIGT